MPGGIFSENLPHIVLYVLTRGTLSAQEEVFSLISR